MPLADIDFGEGLLFILEFFLLVAWFWILITIIGDLFRDRTAGEDYVRLLETLHQDPSRKDIAWLLGIDEDVTNEDIRLAEVRNWIDRLVIPSMALRH